MAGYLGVTQYNPFAQDPDYPQPSSSVNNATKITPVFNGVNPFAAAGFNYPTSPIGSKPIAGDPLSANFNSYGNDMEALYKAGMGTNDLLGQMFYNATPPKPPAVVKPVVPGSSGGGSSGGGSSGTAGMTGAEAIAMAKFNYEKEQDAKKLASFQNYYDSGSYNTGFNALLKMITDQGTISETGVKNAYGRAKTNLDEGFTAAQGLGDAGYAALNKYLGQNQNNPYAGMQATVGSSPDAMSNYLKAYGVSDQPVQGQIQADQLQAQQGAGNYQNLINILSAVAKQGASSRGAESAMGQNLFNTSLGQEKAGYQGQASNAQAQALAALQQQMFQSQYGVANDRNNLTNQIAQALALAGGVSTKTGTDADADAAAAAAAAAKKKKEEDDAAAAAAILAKGNPPLTIEQLLKQIAERQAAGTGNYGGSGGGYGVAPGMEQYAI